MATVPNKNFNTIFKNTKNREYSFFVVTDLLINSGHVIKHTQYKMSLLFTYLSYCHQLFDQIIVWNQHKTWPRESLPLSD